MREPRRVFSHVSDIQRLILKTLMNGLSIIVLFSLVAVAIFSNDSGPFQNFSTAIRSLMVLSTMDNYGSLTEDVGVGTFFFLIAFITVGHVFLMSVVSRRLHELSLNVLERNI